MTLLLALLGALALAAQPAAAQRADEATPASAQIDLTPGEDAADAAQEYARSWREHRRRTRPFAVYQVVRYEDQRPVYGWVRYTPSGYDARGLGFALDYAYFLIRRGETDAALDLLEEVVVAIDMDRNPNLPTPTLLEAEPPADERLPAEAIAGDDGPSASRKELIRLAYGVFKEAGREARLVAALQREIDAGRHVALRVLARVRSLQQRPEEALRAELAYLDRAGFDPLTRAVRRGLAHEGLGTAELAIQAYEEALDLPFVPPLSLPDPDEEQAPSAMTWQPAWALDVEISLPAAPSPNADLLERLVRLYGSVGRTEEALDASLRVLELRPSRLARIETLEQTRTRFQAAGRLAAFTDWLARQARTRERPEVLAALYWTSGDLERSVRAAARISDPAGWTRDQWHQRFASQGPDWARLFLAAWVEHHPADATARWQLLDLRDELADPAAVRTLEELLEAETPPVFSRRPDAGRRTWFRSYYDLAYRLIRSYERQGREQDAVALALRMLEARKPFDGKEREGSAPLPTPRADWHSGRGQAWLVDMLHGVYAALPYFTEEADRARLEALAERSDCIPLQNQVARLREGPDAARRHPAREVERPVAAVEVRTPGLPAGIRLLTTRDDVRSVAPGGRWIGTSWGLVRQRYDGDRLDVVQLPTGGRVTAFQPTPHGLFVGTFDALYRLDDPEGREPSLVRVGVEPQPDPERRRPFRPMELAWLGDRLWVRHGGAVAAYEPQAGTYQTYGEVEGGRMFAAHGRLWCGQRVFDPAEDAFVALELDPAGRAGELIGATADGVWASVWIDDERRHRGALVDPVTLAVQVLSIRGAAREPLLVNGTFEVLGEDAEHVWLVGDGRLLVSWDRTARASEARLVADVFDYDRPAEAREGAPMWAPASDVRWYPSGHRESALRQHLDGDRGPRFTARPGTGVRFIGNARMREWREDNLGFDDNSGMSHHLQDLEGGLFVVREDDLSWEKLGHPADSLTDSYVKRIVFDDELGLAFVCTNGGVTVLSLPDGEVVDEITVSDGLPSNKVEDVARIGRTLFIATELGDDDGGLAALDLDRGLIQVLGVEDGLKCRKVKALKADGTRLHVTYGWMYAGRSRHAGDPRVIRHDNMISFTASTLETTTRTFTDSHGTPAPPAPPRGPATPILGGTTLVDVRHAGKRYLGGTHGLLVLDPGVTPGGMPYETVAAEGVHSRRQEQLAQARGKQFRDVSPPELDRILDGDNPFLRAQALAGVPHRDSWATHGRQLERGVGDAHSRARSTAAYLVDRNAPDGEAVRVLEPLLDDPVPYLRAFALVALGRHGRRPDPRRLAELLVRPDRFGNMPFGADSSVGVRVDRERVYAATAPHADAEIFEVLLAHPLPADDYEPRQRIFRELGVSLRRRPGAARVLLAAYDAQSYAARVRFSQEVFRCAGRELLPVLHDALRSDDRVARSNAARACGAIGDASSVEPLIAALDLESGLSRASIVWALGELRDPRALPHLRTIYSDARNDEARRGGAGFRHAQSVAAAESRARALADLDPGGWTYGELPVRPPSAPIDPRRNEELLEPRHVLDAVAKIGGAPAQEFFRSIAGKEDPTGRWAAARHLRSADPRQVELNLPILRNLMSDDSSATAVAAAVSLLVLGQAEAEEPILAWLESRDRHLKHQTVTSLLSVADRSRLSFARRALEAGARDLDLPSRLREELARLVEEIETASP